MSDIPTPLTDAARGFHDLETAVSAESMAKLEREYYKLEQQNAHLMKLSIQQDAELAALHDTIARLQAKLYTDA